MNPDLVFIKTAAGEEAVRLQTKVMQRNVRTVLILVDGHSTFSELCLKMSNPRLTENALIDLERGGFISRRATEVSRQVDQEAKSQKKVGLSSVVNDPVAEVESGFVFSQFSLAPPEIPSPPIVQPLHVEEEKIRVQAESSREESKKRQPLVSLLVSRFAAWREERREKVNDADVFILRNRRRSLNLRQLLVLGLAGSVSLVVLLVIFFPYSVYLPEVETVLSRSIGRPAKVAHVQVSVYPRPGILLSDVTITRRKETEEIGDLRIAEILLEPSVSTLFSTVREFRNVVVRDVSLPVEAFALLPELFKELRKQDSSVRIDRLHFERTNLLLAGLPFSGMEGEVNLSKDGALNTVQLRTVDRTLTATMVPNGQRIDIALEGFGLRLPVGVPVVFDSANIKGYLERGMLTLSTIELRVFDGLVQGSAVLQSTQKSSIAGNLVFERLNSTRLCSALGSGSLLSGDLAGKVRFSAVADSWPQIFTTMVAEGDFSIQRGSLRGIDFAEAMRRISGAPVQGGTTNFEQFSGKMRLTPTGSRFYNLVMNSGLMQSVGAVELGSNQIIDGRMDLQMRGSVNQTRVPITLGGTLKTPTAQIGRK